VRLVEDTPWPCQRNAHGTRGDDGIDRLAATPSVQARVWCVVEHVGNLRSWTLRSLILAESAKLECR